MKIDISKNNVHIYDSYAYSKKAFDVIIDYAVQKSPDCEVFKRSRYSLKMEWAVHNLLYRLGLYRDRTKDVDLNYPNNLEWLYIILGLFSWLVIK